MNKTLPVKLSFLALLTGVLMSVPAAFSQTILAKWTFDTLALGPTYTNNPPNGWCTNVTADTGSGTASGFHATATGNQYVTSSGNGSAKALSSATWSVGDFYQFALNTAGDENIVV